MAQTKYGAMKLVAGKAGISVEDFSIKVQSGLKWCYKCRKWRIAATEFHADKHRGDGRSSVCMPCRKRWKGPGRIERAQQAANGFGRCRHCKDWRKFPIRAGLCRPCVNAERRKLYAENPAFRAKLQGFVYRRKRGVDSVPPEGSEFLMTLFDGKCAYCGETANTFDHILAVTRGGQTTPGNILPACSSCNSSKGNKDVWDWIEEHGIQLHDLLIDRLVFQYASLYG
jgi:5-methylcytosine-specific restriction endonuclease McrA